jgi:hypothetical protein
MSCYWYITEILKNVTKYSYPSPFMERKRPHFCGEWDHEPQNPPLPVGLSSCPQFLCLYSFVHPPSHAKDQQSATTHSNSGQENWGQEYGGEGWGEEAIRRLQLPD